MAYEHNMLGPSWNRRTAAAALSRERRRCGRHPSAVPMGHWVQNATLEVDGIGRVPAMVRDLSLDGARFEATVPLAVGATPVLHVDIPSGHVAVQCEVKHVRCAGSEEGERHLVCGCCFPFIKPRDAQALVRNAGKLRTFEPPRGPRRRRPWTPGP